MNNNHDCNELLKHRSIGRLVVNLKVLSKFEMDFETKIALIGNKQLIFAMETYLCDNLKSRR